MLGHPTHAEPESAVQLAVCDLQCQSPALYEYEQVRSVDRFAEFLNCVCHDVPHFRFAGPIGGDERDTASRHNRAPLS
jgi:hypothetical protein